MLGIKDEWQTCRLQFRRHYPDDCRHCLFLFERHEKSSASAKGFVRQRKIFAEAFQRILKLSNIGTLGSERKPAESAAQVREAALKLSEMINNLFFSFLNIVNERDKNLEKRADKNLHLSKVSRTARQRIIVVLTVALIFRAGISIYTNTDRGDTKMTREVEIYEHRLSNWIIEQKTILNMFASVISAPHGVMDDYILPP